MKMQHNEVHITLCKNGHVLSTDCWCEPTNIYWYTNDHGVLMLVVEHNDETKVHRLVVTSNREVVQDWITRATNLKEEIK